MEVEQEQRRRKVEAGRTKLAHFRQRKTKGDGSHSEKKTAKRKGSAVDAPVQEESPIAKEDRALRGGGDICKSTSCDDTPDGAALDLALNASFWPSPYDHPPEQQQRGMFTVSDHHPEQRGIFTVISDHHPEQRGMFTVSDHHPEQRGMFTVSDHRPEQPGIFTVSDHRPEQRGMFTVSDHHPEQRGMFTVSDPHPEQREVITKECKQECELAIADLQSSREEEAGLQQSQAVHGLELEALRLSLSNMHTVQLELTQANLQKEKETALTELREMLNSRRAQELALLQSRQQHELELLREQHAREKEEVVLRCGQEAAELKEKLQSEMEKNAQIVKTLKEDWESEKDLCLENLRKELSAKHQSEMEDLQNQFQKELAEQRAELEKIFQDKNQAESALRNLESQHQAAIEKLREDLQSEHCRCLEDLEFKFKEGEKEKQLELENLQASYEDLKAQSQEEIRRLWSQLDSARTSRQELSELHEQLLARASHVEDLEQLKQREKTQHESELEQLRIYFEKKLRDAEKTYQEDLTLLQQRLQGASEDALLDPVEVGLSCVGLEEKPEKGRKDHVDELDPERHKESLPCFQAELEESHRHLLEAPESPLCIQHEGHVSDRCCAETSALGPGWHLEPSEGRSQELPWVHLQGVQDRALEADTEVAARVLGLETEHKVKLSLLQTELKEEIELLKIENRNLYEKLQHETRLKENLEKVKHNLVEDHQEELNNAKQKTELMKQEFQKKEMDWKVMKEELQREAEEKLTLMLLELREKAESEKQTIVNKFELREAEMRQLQDQQAAQILDLERSLTEQQGRLQQLEQELTSDDALRCSQCGREPPAAQDGELAALHMKEDCALQLILARSRFLEERKEITEKFSAEQDAFLQEAQEQHTRELQLLQERHQQRLLSVTAELEARHQAALGELTASLESKQGALLAARVAELQTKHAADLSALETRHLSSLDSLESCYLSEIQTIREEHRRALELLRADFEEQLQKQDSLHQTILTQELEKLKQKHDEELQSVRDGLRTAASTELAGTVAHELQGAHQGEFGSEKKAALHEKEKTLWLQSAQAQPFHQEEKESLSLQLQKKNHQVQQLKDQVLSLSHEIEECRSELEALQQRRERENREGANLLSMLKADVDLSHSERGALQDALRRLLGLFGETLRAAIALRSRIGERVGLCLDDAGAGLALSAAPALEETWSDVALPELDRTLSECAEMSSAAEISSHMRESFLMSPESVRECEQPIRRVFQSLSLAVDGLLEMALDSSRQLEEARQIHSRFEKEFSFKNEETAQVVRKHQELLECLKEESAAKAELALELHKTQGTLEGFKVETADLKETLAGKEDSEHRLVLELESLRRQLQQAAQEQAVLREECTRLWSRGEATAMDAEAREAALRKEVEDLTREQSETRKQAEKDRSALLSQMKILESELEEQLSQHRGCAKQAEAVTALEQQVASLDKHLRNQRQFMDEQAAEREHEREEFQQEIQRLEGQLRQVAKPQPWGPHDSQQAPLDGEVSRRHRDGHALCGRPGSPALDKELLKKQQMSSLLLASTLQSTLDAGSCPEPPPGSPPEGPEVQLEVTQSVLDLKEQLEKMKGDLESKNEEILHLNLKLDLQNSQTAVRLGELQEESVSSKVVYTRSSEIEELKATIENLRENQKRLQKEKAEEIEQLHEVIEKLQHELSLMGPVVHEVSDSQAGSLQSELLCSQAGGPRGQALQGELEAALEAKEALSRLLADQERGHSQALEALQQRLQGAEEAAERQLAELERSAALREAEVEGMASRIQEFEAALKAKEAMIAERNLEIDTLNQRKVAHSAELEAVLLALAHIRRVLEQQPLAAGAEPPELQRLRAQCARLSRQLHVLHQRFLRCQVELDRRQTCRTTAHTRVPGAHPQPHVDGGAKAQVPGDIEASHDGALEPVVPDPQGDLQTVVMTLEDAPLCKQEGVMSVLTVCQRQLQSELLLVKNEMRLSLEDVGKGKEKVLEDCQLQKVDLIAQVKQLQEKLNRLLYSMTFQNVDAADAKSPWPLASAHLLENSWSDGSCDGEEPDTSAPTDACVASAATGGVTDVIKNRDSLIPDEMPDSPIQEKSECQDRSLSSPTSMLGGSCRQSHAAEAGPRKSPVGVLDLSSWSSPEVLRKDWTLEPRPSLPVTPHSGALSLCSADTSLRDRADTSLPQPQGPGLLCSPGVSAAALALQWAESPPADDHRVQRTAVEKDVEDFITTSLDSQETLSSPPPGLEGKTDGSEKSDGSGFGARLSPGSGGPEAPTAGPVTPAAISGRFQPLPEAMKEKGVHPQHVKALLQMVCDESHQILALSEGLAPLTGEPHPPRKGDKVREDLLCGGKTQFCFDVPTVCPDWRGELLQVVQEAFEKEPEIQGVELQPRLSGSDLGGHSFPLERLEKAISEQGDLQEKSLEQLRLPDRSSLLSEIQALRAQLRMAHLQNQEKLQHLRTALTSAEARGSQQEHQLRKQVELLVYKVEQEKCIAGDLQKTLSEEQEKAHGVQKLLAAEQSVVRDLKSELCESRQESERLSRSLCEVQQEVLQLRSMLSSKENELKAALQELESEQGKGRALQSQLEEEQLRHLQREGQSAKALEELRASLETQRAQSSRLCVALKHEQTAKDNLQQELRIEHSRCEALLAQERSQLSELQKDLAAEKSRTLELSEALRHERLLTEQLSQRTQEACVHQDTQAHHALLRKLKDEKSRVADLQAMLEKVQQQALRSQQQLEAEAQEHCEALRREKEVSATLKSTVEALHTQKRELRCSLEREREKPAWLQAELEQSHPRLKEQEGRKAARRSAEAGQSPAAAERWRKWQRDKEKLRELELQRQRDLHKIKQLQQTVRDLESKDEVPGSRLHLGSARRAAGLDADHLREQQRELEAMRQRLLCAAGLLTSFASQAMDRTVNDWTSSNEKAVVSLLHTLEELKSDLSRPTSSQKKMAAELQLQFVDVLLKDNVSLTKALSTVTREKLELSRAVSKLEKMLKHHLQKGCSPSKSERAAWKPDETAPQSSLRRPDPGRLPPAASEEAHPSNVKMEKLYLHYLRAESFRKALIYQKKYLLLLIGGFQDSEQETLSMIAHLGVFPSKAERKTTSRPFTRFRTAVRVVVAVLRLRFLVKKWQEVDRKGALAQGKVLRPGPRVRRPQSPPRTRESPPTRDVPSGHTRDPTRGHGLAAAASPHTGGRATPSPNSRLERSLTASQDPEHSLTEYIHHLEVIQQRLGGALPDSPSKKSCHQKIKQ
uniref:Pericentrin n=1 Tax=Cercocebus atys TaxID=9531 RepID=A0A2K5NCR0_CERAT